jgi:hypothetical protein
MISRSAQVRARGGCTGVRGAEATWAGAVGNTTVAITWFAVPAASQQPATNKTMFAAQLSTEPMTVVRSQTT